MPPFDEYLKVHSKCPLPNQLPLVHTTRCEFFDSIAASQTLQPRRCSVFNEDLLYLFYGRPAFRTRGSNVHEIGYCPICFILKLSRKSLGIRRVFPLDSGALRSERFAPTIAGMEVEELALSPNIASAQMLAQVLYEGNRRYILGRCIGECELEPIPPDILVRYTELQSICNVTAFDDRRSSAEIQATNHVVLADDILAVVLPESYLDDDSRRRTILEEWNALPLTYAVTDATNPSEYIPVIRELVTRFYKEYRFVVD